MIRKRPAGGSQRGRPSPFQGIFSAPCRSEPPGPRLREAIPTNHGASSEAKLLPVSARHAKSESPELRGRVLPAVVGSSNPLPRSVIGHGRRLHGAAAEETASR